MLATGLTLAFVLAPPIQGTPNPQLAFTEPFDAHAPERWHTMMGQWEYGDGHARQTSPEFDCGAVLDVQPQQPYYVAVRFKPDAEFIGGGLYFALPRKDKKNGGMMVRCDVGNMLLYGQFDEAGEFQLFGDASVQPLATGEQEIAVAVDPGRNGANVFCDGRKVATNIKVYRPTGYVGMQSSGGPHTFTRFEVRAATADELAGISAAGPYRGIVDLIGNEQGLVGLRLGTQFLVRFDAAGKELATAAVTDVQGVKGDGLEPVAVSWDTLSEDRVLVLAENGAALYRFDANLKQVGTGPIVRHETMRGADLATDAAGRIFVADPTIPGVRVFDKDGRELLAFGEKGKWRGYERPAPEQAGKFQQPRGIAASRDGLIAVADRDCEAYCVYRYDADARKLVWVTHGTHLPRPSCARFDKAGQVLLAGAHEPYVPYGALRIVTPEGLPVRHFLAHSLGGLSERLSVTAGPGGKLYLADAIKDRVYVLPPDFVEPWPAFSWTHDGSVRLTMNRADGSTVVTTSSAADPQDPGRILVTQREPICETWPPAPVETLRTYAMPPKPPPGKMYVIDMPVLNVAFTKTKSEKGEELEIDGRGVIERLQREFEPVREHHYRNSHCRLNVVYEHMLIDDVQAPVIDGWIHPEEAHKLVNAARAKRGLPTIDADHSLIGLHPMKDFDVQFTDDLGSVGGGGLTPYAYCGFGLWNHGISWLMSHEWGHQLDAYFDKCGMPDWPLDHPDSTVHPGRYGDSWDVNAFICRQADAMTWLRFHFGKLRLVDDQDGDGLPDDDPALPMDEKRFGSDPTRKDTDGDGRDDLAEYMAGTFVSSDPRNPDTNGNGVPDGKDPYPQFRVRPVITQRPDADVQALRSGQPPKDWPPIGTIHNLPNPCVRRFPPPPTTSAVNSTGRTEDDWADGDVYATYAADSLTLVYVLRKPAKTITTHVDFNDDGWFVGHDNVYTTVDLEWPEGGTPSIKRTERCTAEIVAAKDVATLTVTVARPDARKPLAPESCVGIMPRFMQHVGRVAFLIDPFAELGLELR